MFAHRGPVAIPAHVPSLAMGALSRPLPLVLELERLDLEHLFACAVFRERESPNSVLV